MNLKKSLSLKNTMYVYKKDILSMPNFILFILLFKKVQKKRLISFEPSSTDYSKLDQYYVSSLACYHVKGVGNISRNIS